MGELSNCVKCGKLFVKNLYSICDNCRKEDEKTFQVVYTFVRKKENRTATIPEISEGTGVDEDTIMRYVKEGRIKGGSAFPNLTYPCEKCSTHISRGRICENCQKRLSNDLNEYNSEQERIEAEKKANHTYYAFNDND